MTYRPVQTDEGNEKLIPAGTNLDKLAYHLVQVRHLRDMYDEQLKEAQKEVDRAEGELFDAMEGQGLRLIRTPDGTFSLNDLAWAKIIDSAAAREWAENNLPEAITLNHTRLSVVVRQALKAGTPLPPGVEFSLSRKINVRKPE